MSVSIFLPVRKGSERIINKNTRTFAGIEGGLLRLKLDQLKNIDEVEEILVSSNDPICLQIAQELSLENLKIKIFQRPEELGSSSTDLEELIKYVPTITSCDNVLWTHVTSPFCNAKQYIQAINKYNDFGDKEYDSLMSGYDYKEFLLDKASAKIINNLSKLKWPRTQDLQDLFQINNAIFLCSREQMTKGNRVGDNPYLFQTGKISSIDIDDEEDFRIAEVIYERAIK